MSVLSGISRPVIAVLGDISSALDEWLLEDLCREYVDIASIILLGHRTTNDILLPPAMTWINCDPMDELEEVLQDTDIIICPYRHETGIDWRIFNRELEKPVVTRFAVPGSNVHIAHDSAEFIEAVGVILADLLAEPRAGKSPRPRFFSEE